MELLEIIYTARKPSRFYLDSKRVTRERFNDAISAARIAGKSQRCFASRTTYGADGEPVTFRQYSCI